MEELTCQLNIAVERFRALFSSTASLDEVIQCAHRILDCAIQLLVSLSDSDDHLKVGTPEIEELLQNDTAVYEGYEYSCRQVWVAFHLILETRIISHQKMIDVLLSSFTNMKTRIARSITMKILGRCMPYVSTSLPQYKESSDTDHERNQQEEKVIDILKSLASMYANSSEVVSTIFPTLLSIYFYSSPCLCDVLDFMAEMIPRIALQDWVLFIQTMTHLCRNAEKHECKCNPRDVLFEKVKHILWTVRQEWLVLEMSGSTSLHSLKSIKYLDSDQKQTYICVCESITTLMVNTTLVARVYKGILEQVALDTSLGDEQKPWSAMDVFAMITLFSRCETLRNEMKSLIQKLCALNRFPFKFLSDVITWLLREPKTQEPVVTSRGIEANQQGLFRTSIYSFQHHMSSSSLELVVYLMVLPSQQHDSLSYIYHPWNDNSKDVQRLSVKLFKAFGLQHRKELLDSLVALTQPSCLQNMISIAREEDVKSAQPIKRKRRRPTLVESSFCENEMEHTLRSIASLINVNSYSAFTNIMTPNQNLKYVTSAFKVALTAYSVLLTLSTKMTLDDFTQRILIDRLFDIPNHLSSHNHALVDYYQSMLLQFKCSILVSVLHKDSYSTSSLNPLSVLTNTLKTMLFSSSGLGTPEHLKFRQVAGLILIQSIVHRSSISTDKKDEICKYFLRFIELSLERALLEPMCLYWVVLFLSMFCFDKINGSDLLPSFEAQKINDTRLFTKAEVFRQLKIIITRIDIVKKIVDWNISNKFSLDEKRSVSLAFIDRPVYLKSPTQESQKGLVLCLYSLSRKLHSLYIQQLIDVHHLYWWLRFIHALSYSYLYIGREVSPLEWSPEVWVFAALESPFPDDLLSDNRSAPFYKFKCTDNSQVDNEEAVIHICFSILSLGALSAILANVEKYMDSLIENGSSRSKCHRLFNLVEFQMTKIYAIDSFCRKNLHFLHEAYEKTNETDVGFVNQDFANNSTTADDASKKLMNARSSEEKRNSVEIFSNLYIDIFHGDILFNEHSLWKYLLLVSDLSVDVIISTDDPDQFDELWNQTLGRSIVMRTLIIRHIIQRFDYRQISGSVKASPDKVDSLGITSRINCLVRTMDKFLPMLPRLRLIDIYGHECTESSPLVCIYHLVINSAQLLLLTVINMKEHVQLSCDDLINSILSQIGICDDLTCSSLLLEVAAVLHNQANPENREGLEYASWDYVSASHIQYTSDSFDFYLTRIPHSFTATMIEFTKCYSISCVQSIPYYDSLQDLMQLSIKNFIDCDDFLPFRQKLLLHWGIMKGSGKKLYENLSTLVHRINPKRENYQEGHSHKMGLTPKTIFFYYELLLHMTVTSFALAKPTIDAEACSPYQDIQNYLHLFGSMISFFNSSHKYKEKKYRTMTLQVCMRMIKLCHDQLERCFDWRIKHSVLVETGRRTSMLSDPLSLSHLGSLIEMMMTSCVYKIRSMVSEFRLYATDSQLEPIELKSIKMGLKKIDELFALSQRLCDRIQDACLVHGLHASSLELVPVPIQGIDVKKAIVSSIKRKKRTLSNRTFDEDDSREGSSSSISSNSTHIDSASSDPVNGAINFKEDDSEPESESDDSFGVVGRWGRDEAEDGSDLNHNDASS